MRAEWISRLSNQRHDYEAYVSDLIHEPELVSHLRQGTSPNSGRKVVLGPVDRVFTEDHPLALSDSPSRWRRYWLDSEIFDQVNKDVFRTRVDADFFLEPVPVAMEKVTVRLVRGNLGQTPLSPKCHAFAVADVIDPKSHHDRICRLLFLFAKLNFGYIQGMNELIAPLYFTFCADSSLDARFAEADTFFAFTSLMTMQRDVFCKNMDECNGGILGRLSVVGQLLEKTDPPLFAHLGLHGVKVNFFALRWVLLLFAQEFDIPALQQVWDSILSEDSSSSSSSLIPFICVAMVVLVREVLLAGSEFGDIIKILQRFPPFDPKEILTLAHSIRRHGHPWLGRSASALSTASDDLVVTTLSPSRLGGRGSFSKSVLNLVRGKR